MSAQRLFGRPLSRAVSLTALAALALTACGGGPATPDKGGKPAPAETAKPGGDKAERPELAMPEGFALEFRGWRSGDPREQAVLDDGREQLRAGYAAIGAGDPDAGYLAFYNTEAGLGSAKEWVRSYSGKNVTVGGELPVYDAEVRLMGERGKLASLIYCTDERGAYTVHRKTGERVGNPEGSAPTVRYVTTLRVAGDGVWRTDDVRSERGAC
ncbi:hypothetical protein [Streptomyces albidoflavus]|uniref:hypothetical protein n=1 Tax=Streptomyces albidoflavus TaxID=1886 RepID=UPI00331A1D99